MADPSEENKIDHLMNRLVVLVSFLDPLPWVGAMEEERKGPTAQKPHGCHLPGFSFPPLKNMQLDRLVRPREFFLQMTICRVGVNKTIFDCNVSKTTWGDNKMPPILIFRNP